MNNILSTKTASTIFLALILVSGTIATSFPSFMIGVEAQLEYGHYNGYNNYESGYPPQEHPDDNNYNSYESQYSSSQPYYKQEYPSYGKDKSKDSSSKSVKINKFNCINTNININGNNTGDVNIGNKGQGYSDANSYGGGYYDGYDKKQGKGFDCIINNNNTNTNIVRGGGNQTIPEPEPLTCEECFREFLTPDILAAIDVADFCLNLQAEPPHMSESELRNFLRVVDGERVNLLIECLLEAGIEFELETPQP